MRYTKNNESLWQRLIANKWFQVVIVCVVGFVAFLFFRKVNTDKKKKGETQDNHDAAASLMANDQSYTQEQALQRILELKQIAENCSKAIWGFHTYMWGTIILWNVTEDEEAVILQLNRLHSGTEAILVSQYYAAYNAQYDTATLTTGPKGMSLKADVNKYLSSSEIARIPAVVRQNLQ